MKMLKSTELKPCETRASTFPHLILELFTLQRRFVR